MSPLALTHVLLGALALLTGLALFRLRKGDGRHRALGWFYVACLGTSLVAILASGRGGFSPFHGYAAVLLASLFVAAFAPRARGRVGAWRAWHGALMSLSTLGALVAVGGVVGGVVIGEGTGPRYYRMFNVVIVVFTAIGLAFILTRPVIWGRKVAPRDRSARAWYSAFVVTLALALVVAQMTFRMH